VALVTPFADGMNLVAKEFIAAQDPDDPGVLILSHFAGAAEQLRDAILVNPHDVGEMAQAIESAINMPKDERVARHRAMHAAVFDENIGRWTQNYLGALRGSGQLPV
jgi:trehalose 6-phosphate synthase